MSEVSVGSELKIVKLVAAVRALTAKAAGATIVPRS